jgi:tetratricopeptide (TPR) repeat protein
MSGTINSLLQKAERALERDETVVALLQLEAAHAIKPLPGVKSKLAYCIARERRQYKQARALCLEALHADPSNPDHYYQLSRIHLLTGKKQAALKTLRMGLKYKRHQQIIDELNRLGFRKEPYFTSLTRGHFLNRSAGLLLTKLGSR